MKQIIRLSIAILLLCFASVGVAKQTNEQYIEVIFKDSKFLSYSEKNEITGYITAFGKRFEDGSRYIVENNIILYENISMGQKSNISYRADEKDLNNDGIYEVFILEACPTYLCGTVGAYLMIFYKIDGKYKKVFSNNVIGYAINKNKKKYPDLLFRGIGFICSYWTWDKNKKNMFFVRL